MNNRFQTGGRFTWAHELFLWDKCDGFSTDYFEPFVTSEPESRVPDGVFGNKKCTVPGVSGFVSTYEPKVFVPTNEGWAEHFTDKGGTGDRIMYLSSEKFTIVDIDRKTRGGAPLGVIAIIKTDRGVQWIYPRPNARSLQGDGYYTEISVGRGYFGSRVLSPVDSRARTISPGPAVVVGGPGYSTYRYLAQIWQEAGGVVIDPPVGLSGLKRRVTPPETLGRLDRNAG